MQILNKTKEQNAGPLGMPVMAENLGDDPFSGESAWSYRVGSYTVTVGYYHNISKYVAFQKQEGGEMGRSDIRGVMGYIGPMANWTPPLAEGQPANAVGGANQPKPSPAPAVGAPAGNNQSLPDLGSIDFLYHDPADAGASDVMAYYSTEKCYFFAHLTTILIDREAIDAKMPDGRSGVGKPKTGFNVTDAPAPKPPAGGGGKFTG